jgi:hypothetical protein
MRWFGYTAEMAKKKEIKIKIKIEWFGGLTTPNVRVIIGMVQLHRNGKNKIK